MIPLIGGSQNSQTETESRLVVTWGSRGWGMGNQCLMGTKFQFYKMEKVWEMGGGV